MSSRVVSYRPASIMEFIDSHTAGEPTRVIVSGGPDLGAGPMSARLALLRSKHDHFRRRVIHEPRGHDALVGALLCEPADKSCVAGAIFFNRAGYLGMCGHAAMGVAVTLAHLGRVAAGAFKVETPVGVVQLELLSPNCVLLQNVPAYRYRKQATVEVPGVGQLTGDVVWSGNWFFLVGQSPLTVSSSNLRELSDLAWKTYGCLRQQGVTGADGAQIDHIEFFGPPQINHDAHGKNYVMCPGGEYDRSPCGTGTSAKLACLAAENRLRPGEPWVQEGILGTCFTGTYQRLDEERIVPTIEGHAFVTLEGRVLCHAEDPFRDGISLDGPA